MKKENRMDDKAKAPDPDDLSSELPPDPKDDRTKRDSRKPEDRSAPHVPPHE
jgi:hypothetical protein